MSIIKNVELIVKVKIFEILAIAVGCALFVYWMNIGAKYYHKVVPYYDSLSYQLDYVGIIDTNRANGYLSSLGKAYKVNTTYAFQLLTAVFAPVLPREVSGLYYVIFFLVGMSMFSIFVVSKKLSGKSYIPFVYILVLCGLPVANNLIGGVLDQRLDLYGAYLYLASVMLSVYFFKNISQPKWGVLWGFMLFLSILHRPLAVMPLGIVNLGLLLVNLKGVLRDLLKIRYYVVSFWFILIYILATLLWISKDFFYYYYFVWNIDVGKSEGVLKSLQFIIESTKFILGNEIIIFVFLAITIALLNKKWRELLEWSVIMMGSFLPYILGGAGSNKFVFIPAVITILIPLLWTPSSKKGLNLVVSLLLFMMMAVSIQSIISLESKVDAMDGKEKEELSKIIIPNMSTGNQTFVSGAVPVAGSFSAIHYFNGLPNIRNGKLFFHATDFGLGKKYPENEELIRSAVEKKLKEVCNYPGIFMALGPLVKDDKGSYLFVASHNKIINEMISKEKCLTPSDQKVTYEGNEILFYVVN